MSEAAPVSSSSRGVPIVMSSPKLGAACCATIICPAVDEAAALYGGALGYAIVEEGVVSAPRAAAWGAPACAGARYALLAVPGRTATLLRFIEDPDAQPPVPYRSKGWTALELSVRNSDEMIARLDAAGFTVVGPADDLDFSQGALRAGQVSGPFGEILYLTQINAQLDDYTLPATAEPVGAIFIVILCVTSVNDSYRDYATKFGMVPKEPFHAAVPFIADFQERPRDTSYYVGCLELVPTSYVEVDEMGEGIGRRRRRPGALPAGIAIVTFEAERLDAFRSQASGPPLVEHGPLYQGCESLSIEGPHGELIEIVERVSRTG